MSTTNKLINILKKEDRSVDDIQFLKAYLSKIKFFQQVFESFKASPEINNDLCRAVKYETFPKFQIIFKQGDTNCDKAYIILKGGIIVLMKNTVDVFQKESEVQINYISDINSVSQVELLLESQFEQNDEIIRNEIPEKDYYTVLCNQYGKVIVEVEEGALFGEKALIENRPRAATICSKSPCEFLIMHKVDFEVIQSKYNKIQNDKKEFILAKFPFLSNLITSARVFERIVRFFDEETYHKNQVLINEGTLVSQENQKIYIIVSGEVQLYKNIEKKTRNNHSLVQARVEQIHVATLSNNEIFGEELFECNSQNIQYQYSVVCVSSNSQFLTINSQIIDKKLPDQIKEYILTNYQIKKSLRSSITKEYENQQNDVMVKAKDHKNDPYEVEKNLLTKVKQISKGKQQFLGMHKNQTSNVISHFKDGQIIQNSISKASAFVSNEDLDKQETYFNAISEQQQQQQQSVDDSISIQENVLEAIQFNKFTKHSSDFQSSTKNNLKSIDSEDQFNLQNERLQAIKGNSDQQNMFLFHQLKNDLYDKITKKGGYQKDINLSFFYEHGLKEDEQTQQFHKKRCNPYPFKLTANHKHLKQLETRLKQKKFQYADAQEILSNTKYYLAMEKKELQLKNIVDESFSHRQKNEDVSSNKMNQQNNLKHDKIISQSQRNMLSSIGKRTPEINPKEKDIVQKFPPSLNSQQVVKKAVGITNLFKESINTSEFGNNVDNTGRNLFGCTEKIKLHSILNRISQNYKPHNDYYTNSNTIEQFQISKYNSEQFFKYYEMSCANKSSIQTRAVLSRSPIMRRVNIAQSSAINGGGVSIPSNKRFITDNDHNVNQNYYYFKNSLRPSSDEARYGDPQSNRENNHYPQNNKGKLFQCMIMQSSSHSSTNLKNTQIKNNNNNNNSNSNSNSNNNPIQIQAQKISVKFTDNLDQTNSQQSLNKKPSIMKDSQKSNYNFKKNMKEESKQI